MGLFTRRAPAATWHPYSTDVESGGDTGGDIQVGKDSYSVTFIRDDKRGSLLTVTFYPVAYPEAPREFAVQRQVEWMVCDDPSDSGGTEVWSDVEYTDLEDAWYASAGQAEAAARDSARAVLADGSPYWGWDGDPEW